MKTNFLELCGLFLLLFACTAEPDSATNGCERKCDNAKIAGSEASVLAISPDMTVTCLSASTQSPTIVTAAAAFFMSYNGSAATAGSTATNSNDRITVPAKLPIAGAAFVPLISGSFVRYITPKSDWCTDSCGIARIEFEAACPTKGSGGSGSLVQLLSGAAGTIDNSIKTGAWKLDLKEPVTSSTPSSTP